MSNERSPREVCSITIGINELMSDWLLATGGPQFRLLGWLFLVGGPERLTGGGPLGRDPLDLGGNAVEDPAQTDRLALNLVNAGFPHLLDHLVGLLEAVAEGLVDLLVGHLDPELVGGRLQHELAGDRRGGLFAEPRDEILGGVA